MILTYRITVKLAIVQSKERLCFKLTSFKNIMKIRILKHLHSQRTNLPAVFALNFLQEIPILKRTFSGYIAGIAAIRVQCVGRGLKSPHISGNISIPTLESDPVIALSLFERFSDKL